MKKIFGKTAAFVLTVVMLVSLFGMTAFAEEPTGEIVDAQTVGSESFNETDTDVIADINDQNGILVVNEDIATDNVVSDEAPDEEEQAEDQAELNEDPDSAEEPDTEDPSSGSEETPSAVTSVELDQPSAEMGKGESVKLTATVLPEDAPDKTVTWSTSDESIATVDEEGNVAAVSGGTAVITVTTADGGLKAECEVKVVVPATGFKLASSSLVLATKETLELEATFTPEDATETELVWESKDESVAAVKDGVITAKGYGKTVITASLKDDPSITAECSVETRYYDVNDPAQYYFTPVYWAADKGITKGYNNNEYFGPQRNCTRKELMIFLWRFCGKPAASGNIPFSDVNYDSSTDSYNAILWGTNEGLIKGYDDGTFRPNAAIARKDVLIILFRLAGRPVASGNMKFSDVSTNTYKTSSDTYHAILWGINKGITAGYKDGSFKPTAACLREHIVTFIYRYDKSLSKPYYFEAPELKSANPTDQGIVVTWGKTANATGYKVYRKSGNGNWTQVANVTSASYTDQNTNAGTTYTYTVRAYNKSYSDNNSDYDAAGISAKASTLNGIITKNGKKYYYSGGKAQKNCWKKVNGDWYYFGSNGVMVTGTQTINRTVYHFRSNGVCRDYTTGEYATDMLKKAQNYSSETQYLILVDCGRNRIGIYERNGGKWAQKFFWPCTTGKGSTPTVKGEFTITYNRGYSFGDDTYTCYWYSGFYGGYLIHSVKYYPGTYNLKDGRLGKSLSMGCVRLHIDNAKWVYDNCPVGTKVVTYR